MPADSCRALVILAHPERPADALTAPWREPYHPPDHVPLATHAPTGKLRRRPARLLRQRSAAALRVALRYTDPVKPKDRDKRRNDRWMTAGVTAVGVGGGAGAGAVVGASMGIAALGTAIAATLPFALAGGAIVGLAAYAVRASRKKRDP